MPPETHERDRGDGAPPLGALYDVGGGRRLMLHHAGTGSPAVVIEAGAGAFGLDYLNLLERCAQRTTCVLYDRAGSGWSDAASGPRGAKEIVTDLRDALRLAGIARPYLLLGHSYGGLLAQAFAQAFPQDVVGLVLIEPFVEGIPLPEEGDEAAAQGMVDELRRNPDLMREWYRRLFAERCSPSSIGSRERRGLDDKRGLIAMPGRCLPNTATWSTRSISAVSTSWSGMPMRIDRHARS